MKPFRSIYLSLFVLFLIGCKTPQTTVTTEHNLSTFEKLSSMENVVSIEKKQL